MKNPESKAGHYGWIGLTAGIIAFDCLSPQTLSEAADELLEHKVGKYVFLGAVAVTAAHLTNLFEHFDIPDPIHELSTFVTEGLREKLGHGAIQRYGDARS